MLNVANLGRRFGALWAVRDVSFAVREGEILGIIGPNGAGKSTLFNVIAGAIGPSSGEIRFLQNDITGAKPYRIARLGLARTFQIPKPFKQLTVGENVMLSALRRHGSTRSAAAVAEEALRFAGIEPLADKTIASLTLGALKKLELARALATEPTLLLLDEVMAGLTAREIVELMQAIRALPERGITVLWVEHVMAALMQVAHQVIVMQQGRIVARGTPVEIANDPVVIAAYLGETYVHVAHP